MYFQYISVVTRKGKKKKKIPYAIAIVNFMEIKIPPPPPPTIGMAIFPRTTGWGEDGFRLCRPTPPRPFPSPPRPTLLRVIIINFSYLKTLLFK